MQIKYDSDSSVVYILEYVTILLNETTFEYWKKYESLIRLSFRLYQSVWIEEVPANTRIYFIRNCRKSIEIIITRVTAV